MTRPLQSSNFSILELIFSLTVLVVVLGSLGHGISLSQQRTVNLTQQQRAIQTLNNVIERIDHTPKLSQQQLTAILAAEFSAMPIPHKDQLSQTIELSDPQAILRIQRGVRILSEVSLKR